MCTTSLSGGDVLRPTNKILENSKKNCLNRPYLALTCTDLTWFWWPENWHYTPIVYEVSYTVIEVWNCITCFTVTIVIFPEMAHHFSMCVSMCVPLCVCVCLILWVNVFEWAGRELCFPELHSYYHISIQTYFEYLRICYITDLLIIVVVFKNILMSQI